MKFTQITLKQQVELERGIIQNYEQKFIEIEEGLRLNKAMLKFWKDKKRALPRGESDALVNQAIAAAEKAVTEGIIGVQERDLGHPILVARLEALTILADAEAEREEARRAVEEAAKAAEEAAKVADTEAEDYENSADSGELAEVDESPAVAEASEIIHDAPSNGKSRRQHLRELAPV